VKTLISLTPPVLCEGRCKDFPACHHGERESETFPSAAYVYSHTSVHNSASRTHRPHGCCCIVATSTTRSSSAAALTQSPSYV
jgi:hypothetical protein